MISSLILTFDRLVELNRLQIYSRRVEKEERDKRFKVEMTAMMGLSCNNGATIMMT